MSSKVTKFSHSYDSHDILDYKQVEDQLERRSLINSLVGEIRADVPPQVIGLYGRWGSGKSQTLSLLIRELLATNDNAEVPILIAIYKTWRYEMENDLASGLIRSIAKFDEQHPELELPSDRKKQLRQLATKLLPLVSSIGESFGTPGKIVAKVSEVAQKHLEDKEDHLESTVDRIAKKMRELVDEILQAAKEADPCQRDYRLIVFIDDLDRCSPVNMIKMFEWLKVHLRVENCIYIMGLDHTAAARAIVGHYREYLDKDADLAYGLRYLEKLVDSDYQLGFSPTVEEMAVQRLYSDITKLRNLSEAAHFIRKGYFIGEAQMSQLLKLNSLQPPRTMLKIIRRYQRIEQRIQEADMDLVRKELPDSYSFWILFIAVLYYRLNPDAVAEFLRGRGILYNIFTERATSADWDNESFVMQELCQFATKVHKEAEGLQVPNHKQLARLSRLIFENS